MSQLEQAQALYASFSEFCRSAMLATADASGQPHVSYAPFVQDEARHFYIFASGLSTHTHNLQVNPRASLMLIADEANSEQIFARRRLTWNCRVQLLPRASDRWLAIADQFQLKFGEIVTVLRQLPDFRLLELIPSDGQFVSGFGETYRLDAAAPDQLQPRSSTPPATDT